MPLVVVGLAVAVSIKGLRDFGPPLETVVGLEGGCAFAITTWLGLVGVLIVCIVGILRFTAAWQALEGLLELFSGTKMVKVFRSIPTDIVRAARPALLGEQSWRAPGFGIRPHPRGVGANLLSDWRPRVIDQSELAAVKVAQGFEGGRVFPTLRLEGHGKLDALQYMARALDIMGMFEDSGSPESDPADTAPPGMAAGHAMRAGIEERPGIERVRKAFAFHFALEIGFFVAQTMFALRRLAVAIVLSLTLAIILTRIYPWQAQSLLTWALAVLMIWALAALSYVIAKMSAQPVLHEIAQTSDTGTNWGLTMVFNLVVFLVLPLFGYLATSIPTVRTFLVSWLEPVTRALAR